MVSNYARRQKSGSISIKIFKNNRYKGKRKIKEKRVGVGAEKQSSKWRLAWVNLGGGAQNL